MSFNFSDNYFQLFGLPISPVIDEERLDARYKSLQRELHPDRFASATEGEKRWSMQATSLINQARQTLLDPLSRAAYLLSLNGIDLASETDTTMPQDFLILQMDLRESLESLKTSEQPCEKLNELKLEVRRHSGLTEALFTEAYAEDQLEIARTKVREWQFLEKLRAEIDEIEGEMDIDYA